MTETFRAMHEVARERRKVRRHANALDIVQMRQHGFTVEKLTDYQYRINGVLDLYPTNGRFHHITENKRGRYGDALAISKRLLETAL